MCKKAARIGINEKINIWLAVISWWKINKKVHKIISKLLVNCLFLKLFGLLKKFLVVIKINETKNIFINLKSPINLLKFSWSLKLV